MPRSPLDVAGERGWACSSSSVEDSPCSSIRSATLVRHYGSDMNHDLAIITKLEDTLAREVDHCELQVRGR